MTLSAQTAVLPNALDIPGLADTLHRGNSAVPDWCRRAFYGAKDFLVKALGTPLERDIQRIDDPCFACDGTGEFGHWRVHRGEWCYRCNGTGVFRSRRIWLDKYRLGDFTFHCPDGRIEVRPEVEPTIIGRIKHEPRERAADCAATIAWLFNRDQLRAEIEGHSFAFGSECFWLTHLDDKIACGEYRSRAVIQCRDWLREKRYADARAWKELIEQRVDSCPF